MAVTRAEEVLYITNAARRTIYGNTQYTLPSRFIDEMGDTIERNDLKKAKLEPKEELVRVWDYTVTPTRVVKAKNNTATKDVNVGDKVKHKKWGFGTVVQVKDQDDDKELVIVFDNIGLKRLLLSIAPIEIV